MGEPRPMGSPVTAPAPAGVDGTTRIATGVDHRPITAAIDHRPAGSA